MSILNNLMPLSITTHVVVLYLFRTATTAESALSGSSVYFEWTIKTGINFPQNNCCENTAYFTRVLRPFISTVVDQRSRGLEEVYILGIEITKQ